ncbi:MAG: PD-(D/E)XK nuclease family protein [Candidatus Pacebacteria bacterium]|nr:PD-(D/E)XK nuclease family protein [Candidatus Paceibacterota bacterium]
MGKFMAKGDTNQGRLEFGKAHHIAIRTGDVEFVSEAAPVAKPVYTRNSTWRRRSYEPGSKTPFALSRSKVDQFLKCPRCFYLDARLGIKTPSMPSFTLNVAVDHLLKKEFDIRRAEGVSHPLMDAYSIDAVPAQHADLEIWRENFKGVRVVHKATNFELFGAIDDLWINPAGEYHIVDYKATSTTHEISLDDQWKRWYKIQAEFYQWLFRARDFKVNDIAYFVFANATKDREAFDAKLEFEVTVVSHKGTDEWVEPTLVKMKECLDSDTPPAAGSECEYCQYVEKVKNI